MKPPIDTAAQNVTPPPVMIEHVSLPVPPKHHVYLPIPDDLPIRAITGEGIQGLCRIDSGNLVDEFGGAMHEVLSEVRRLGRKGKLSLSLVIAPGGADSLSIEYDVNPKPPKEKRNPSMIFCTSEGQLVTRNPTQMEMDLRHAPKPEQSPLRSVAPPEQTPLRTAPAP